jgi:chromosome transmission fidelity protein 1
MIGLPFPNRFSVELNEKIKYADSQAVNWNSCGFLVENIILSLLTKSFICIGDKG